LRVAGQSAAAATEGRALRAQVEAAAKIVVFVEGVDADMRGQCCQQNQQRFA